LCGRMAAMGIYPGVEMEVVCAGCNCPCMVRVHGCTLSSVTRLDDVAAGAGPFPTPRRYPLPVPRPGSAAGSREFREGAICAVGWRPWESTLEWKWKSFAPAATAPAWCVFMAAPWVWERACPIRYWLHRPRTDRQPRGGTASGNSGPLSL